MGNGQRVRMHRAVGWRTGGEARNDGRRGADGRGMHRASPAEGGRCGTGALAERARTGRAERPLNSRSADGWRKAGRIPSPRGLPTPYENEGGLLGVRTFVNRRRGAGCGGVNGAFIMAKLVGCYSHPRCFFLASQRNQKNQMRMIRQARGGCNFRGRGAPRGCRGNGLVRRSRARCDAEGGAGGTRSGHPTGKGGARPDRAGRRCNGPWGRRGTRVHDAPADAMAFKKEYHVMFKPALVAGGGAPAPLNIMPDSFLVYVRMQCRRTMLQPAEGQCRGEAVPRRAPA